jgi:signal transduction histidine kinase
MGSRTTDQPESQAMPEEFFGRLNLEFLIHELKDPLAVIETGLRTLLERQDKTGPLTERQQRTLERVLRSSRKARDMVYGLLEVGRSEAGQFHYTLFDPVDATLIALREAYEAYVGSLGASAVVFDDTAAQIAFFETHNITVTAEIEKSWQLAQDVEKFRQIAGNLIKNAFQYRRQKLIVRIEQQDDNLALEVSDDGPGIDKAFHLLIFDRYARPDVCAELGRKGHGLGLAGARALARCLGGDVTLTSAPDHGATFRLWLPGKPELVGVCEA